MKNQSGFITTEFLFAMVIAFGFFMIVFAMSFTLSVVEVTQYAVYSAARAHAAANFDQEAQTKQAQTKFESLITSDEFRPLFSNGWFEVSTGRELDIRGDKSNNFQAEYGPTNRGSLQGVRTNFQASLLELRLPFIGNVVSEDGSGFKTKIVALLVREPSMRECQIFMERRAQEVWNLGEGRFQRFSASSADAPIPWEDNGC